MFKPAGWRSQIFSGGTEVCDLGSHFTKDAAEHLLLPTWQGEWVSPPGEGDEGFLSKWYFDIWEKPSIFCLDIWRVLGSGSVIKNLEDIVFVQCCIFIEIMSFWRCHHLNLIEFTSFSRIFGWRRTRHHLKMSKSYLLGKVQLAFRANQSCRNWCTCLWTIRRADSTVGRQHTLGICTIKIHY